MSTEQSPGRATVPVHMRIPVAVMDWVDERARSEMCARSDVFTRLVVEAMRDEGDAGKRNVTLPAPRRAASAGVSTLSTSSQLRREAPIGPFTADFVGGPVSSSSPKQSRAERRRRNG